MVLQREVERVLTARNWSLLRAEMQTGISSGTINRMKKGLNVAAKTVVEFGAKVGEPVERWQMVAVGRDPDAVTTDGDRLLPAQPVLSPEMEQILEYIEDPETREAVKYFHGLPPELRGPALASLAGMAKYKDAGEIARELEEEATHGKRAGRRDMPDS